MHNIIIIFLLMSLSACSSDSDEPAPKNDHIWKNQTDALKQAEDLAEQLEDEFKKKMEQMEKSRH